MCKAAEDNGKSESDRSSMVGNRYIGFRVTFNCSVEGPLPVVEKSRFRSFTNGQDARNGRAYNSNARVLNPFSYNGWNMLRHASRVAALVIALILPFPTH